MKFCWTTLTVDNMDDSLKFYQEIVGLPISKKYPAGPGVEISFLGEGETKLELICDKNQTFPKNVGRVSLGFEVVSLDEKIKFIQEKGIEIADGPFQPNPHIKFFFVKDPNGFSVQFVENM